MANFVQFPAPVGMIKMDYVNSYTPKENDGIFGISVSQGNGTVSFIPFGNEAERDTFLVNIDIEFLLDI